MIFSPNLKRSIYAATLDLVLSFTGVVAAPVSIEAVMSPQEQMKFKFADGSKQFVLAVRREVQSANSSSLVKSMMLHE